ncbi:MAG: acireductone dioxygenase [Leptospiraceae bacterium]|nr:acireductone dioxygenase [Leptospiraceae bacterium]
MSLLKVFSDNNASDFQEFTEFDEIRQQLADAGIRFERWQAEKDLSNEATQDQIIEAYRESIDKLKKERGFITVDVVSIHPETPNHPEMRKKFLDEHTHSEDEVRFFVDGSGAFYIHKNQKVLQMICERNDLLSVPAGTKHWFDMGPKPFFKAIRLFNNPEGWVAKFTGDKLAQNYPRYQE